jgi:hypothetical protein
VTTGKFQSFNKVGRTLIVKDAIGTAFEFGVRDDTEVTGSQRMDDYLDAHAGLTPWSSLQSLTISWKPSADGKKRIATSIR